MTFELSIRPAEPSERDRLEELQRRASLAWEEYRGALLADPDAVDLPIDHLSEGRAFVAELRGEPAGFCVVLPRDGEAELDGLFVEPAAWRSGIGSRLVREAERAAV